MGAAPGPSPVNQVSFEYTATKSIFTFDVGGKVALTATFLSPVYPSDLFRQSMQFSYLQASVESSDGAPHDVQIYSDISGGKTTVNVLVFWFRRCSCCHFTAENELMSNLVPFVWFSRMGRFGHLQFDQLVKRPQ